MSLMVNLLPLTERKKVRRRYAARIATAALLFLALLCIAGVALLVPSYLIAKNKRSAAKERAALVAASLAESGKTNEAAVIGDLKERLTLAERASLATDPFTLFESAAAVRPRGVVLGRYFYTAKDAGNGRAAFGGIASRRDDLAAFVRALEESGFFGKVEFPVGNLTKSSDIEFSIVAQLNTQ